MSLQFVRPEFVLCPSCAAKPGSPTLCRECLERRELISLAEMVRRDDRVPEGIRRAARLCWRCSGTPSPECPEHGR